MRREACKIDKCKNFAPGVDFINCFVPNADLSRPKPNFYATKMLHKYLGIGRKSVYEIETKEMVPNRCSAAGTLSAPTKIQFEVESWITYLL